MKIKPILFNAEMVRAILEDRKTMTRRVVKPQPGELLTTGENALELLEAACAPCRPDDVLYVRETFRVDYLSNIPGTGRIQYKADGLYRDFSFTPARYDMMRRAQLKPGWRPNENMPREAARIFLRVTGVRAEGLHEITLEDIKKEGIQRKNIRPNGCECAWSTPGCQNEPCPNRDSYEFLCWGEPFLELWDSTIKPADRTLYGWKANPWVWVIEFKIISKENVGDGQTD